MKTTRKAYIQNVLLSSIRTKAFPRDKGVTYAADRRGSQFTQITCDHESHISKMTSQKVQKCSSLAAGTFSIGAQGSCITFVVN